jgi:basic amino acid/polyamine antiporter, APA family
MTLEATQNLDTSVGAGRKLGPWMCLALVMGNMIGSGVFLLPASLAPFGWNAVFGWIFTICGVLTIVAVLARLTRALPGVDGPYGYTLAAFGPRTAFLIGYSYWISVWVGNAAIATAAVSYLSIFFPALGTMPGAAPIAAIGLVWAATLINMRGARAAGGMQMVTMLIKLVPLIVVIVLIAAVIGRSHGAALAPFNSTAISVSAVSGAAALSLWALVGFESASLAFANIESPDVTVPRATMIGTVLTGLLYLVVCSGISLILPLAVAATSDAPMADFVAAYWGSGPALFIALFAAISAIGALNGLTMLQGAVPLSLARTGGFPKYFGVTNGAGTPVRALVGSSVLTTILVVMNSAQSMGGAFAFMALLATSVTLFLYFGVAVAAIKLKVGGAVAIFAAAFALWTLWGAGVAPSAWSFVLLLSGIPVYALVQRASTKG